MRETLKLRLLVSASGPPLRAAGPNKLACATGVNGEGNASNLAVTRMVASRPCR